MRTTRVAFVVLAVLSGCRAEPEPVSSPQRAHPVESTPRSLSAAAGGHAASLDARGVPNFIWAVGTLTAAPGSTPEQAARSYLDRFRGAHGLSAADLETAQLQLLRDLGDGGYLAKFRQVVGGVWVRPGAVSVLMRPNLELVVISGHLYPAHIERGDAPLELSAVEALAAALSDALGQPISAAQLVELEEMRGPYRRFTAAAGAPFVLPEGANVQRIHRPHDGRLEAADFIEFYVGLRDGTDSEALRYLIDARSGRVVERRRLRADDAFAYRVWADSSSVSRPLEGPVADFSPHPTGVPDGSEPAIIGSSLILMEGFNHNPSGGVDPWLASNATETRGNNVDAYSDDNAPDGFSAGDLRATITGPRSFDRSFAFDIAANANPDQVMASVTDLFYVNNWLHDWWYDAGFDEVAGNAQLSNFGRGGIAGDLLLAQAQDNVLGGARNNANMTTPSDGLSPRMQMYQWRGADVAGLTAAPGGNYPTRGANFGSNSVSVSAELALGDDGTGTTSDGCEPLLGDVSGRVVLVDRGACSFVLKALNAQAAGAAAVLIANNSAGSTPPALGGTDASVTVGTFSVTQADGAAMRAARLGGPVTVTLFRQVSLDRDGVFDHTVVTHEWGHYLHHRLQDCGTRQCSAMSEGWGDWNSVYMTLAEGEDLEGAYVHGAYAARSEVDGAYFGTRRTPYSTDFAIDGLMFRHIADGEALPSTPLLPSNANSEVHNAGEVWATLMWEAYVALLRQADGSPGAPSFAGLQRRMAEYVVAGLQLSPVDATFTETRDAILAVAAVRSPADLQVMAAAFARRGAGTCAQSPPRSSTNFVGVVESTELRPRVEVGTISVDSSLRSCDGDGVLDAEERGRLRIAVSNPSPVALSDLTIDVSAVESAVLFPAGATIAVPTLGPFARRELELEIALDATLTTTSALTLRVRARSPLSCEGTVTSTVIGRVNFDTVRTSTVDDVESPTSAWTRSAGDGAAVWSREVVGPNAHAWRGLDLPRVSDTWLESPSLVVSSTGAFVIRFDHRHSFEASGGTLWDGGVIELSPDDGQTWSDLSTYVDPGYSGALSDSSRNPLALRAAFAGTNPSWPARDRVHLDLGGALAGQTVRLRFRIGSDAATGAFGWELDDLGFAGITGTPFDALVVDATICPDPLIADAGADQTVDPQAVVFLDGSGSSSAENLPLSFDWTQLDGPPATLTDGDTARPSFVAPTTGAAARLRFSLSVSDGTRTATDAVVIDVRASPPLIADAGADQTVDARAQVLLDGSRSRVNAPLPLSFSWEQTSGPMVALSASASAMARFEAPVALAPTTLRFTLTVGDGTRSALDSVDVVVNAAPPIRARAGADQTTETGATVVLDGTQSEGAPPLAFGWTQTSGPPVNLARPRTPLAQFAVPPSAAGQSFEFALSVSDGTQTATDTVRVSVEATPALELTADAGPDQRVGAGVTVALDGSSSRSSANLPLTYLWVQASGPSVVLTPASGATATFVAPSNVGVDSVLVFSLTVNDGTRTQVDRVVVEVAAATSSAIDEAGGCSCATGAAGGEEIAWALMLGLTLSVRRRAIAGRAPQRRAGG